jgi:hypothetical protein
MIGMRFRPILSFAGRSVYFVWVRQVSTGADYQTNYVRSSHMQWVDNNQGGTISYDPVARQWMLADGFFGALFTTPVKPDGGFSLDVGDWSADDGDFQLMQIQ